MTDRAGRIQGIVSKPLRRFSDDRGYLVEVMRVDDDFFGGSFAGFGQTVLTMSYPGVIKAFHYHLNQDDAWYVVRGNLQVVLFDLRDDSPTQGVTEVYYLGDGNPALLVIPRGVAHGYRVLGPEPAWLMYHVSQPYHPEDPDEHRLAYDDPRIAFDWQTHFR